MNRSPKQPAAVDVCRPHACRAFTLLEVMFAILLLGVGLVAVAGIFPIAGSIQRDTVDQTLAQSVATSAEAVLMEKGITAADLTLSVPNFYLLAAAKIPERDRCYPYFEDADGNGTPNEPSNSRGLDEDHTFTSAAASSIKRQMYWCPVFYKNTLTNNWQVFVFVMRNIGLGEPVPTTTGLPLAGDLYVKADGTVGTAISDNDSGAAGAWHAPISGTRSSFVQLSVLGTGVVQQ